MYIGNAFISQQYSIPTMYKIIFAILLWIFAIIMIHKYAPADTEDVPVISKVERLKRRKVSYVIVTIMLIVGSIIEYHVVSNILLLGVLLQTITITRFAYKITNNKYGYEQYLEENNAMVN